MSQLLQQLFNSICRLMVMTSIFRLDSMGGDVGLWFSFYSRGRNKMTVFQMKEQIGP